MKKSILIAVIAFPTLVGGGVFFAKDHVPNSLQNMIHAGKVRGGVKSPQSGKVEERREIVADLEPFAVNLAGPGFSHYLRISVRLSLSQEQDKERIKDAAPQIRDALLMLLTSKKADELLTTDGKTILRGEIAKKINAAAGSQVVLAVYFKDFLIQ